MALELRFPFLYVPTMSNDSSGNSPPHENMRGRRGSVTSAAFSNLFQRSNSTTAGTNVFPGPVSSAVVDNQRRRLSVTTLGLSGSSPTNNSPFVRRASLSTNNSDSIDESAVDDEDTSRTAPTTPFTRRMSFGAGAMRNMRPGSVTSPGSAADQGYNWSEQLRSRAESSVSGARPNLGFGGNGGNVASSPRGQGTIPPPHERAKSVSDMPAPPAQAAGVRPKQPEIRKPDAMQERILKGDFYMD